MSTNSRTWLPVLTLLVAPPVISELLSGSARISTLPILIPATGVWGCAALMIREFVHWRCGDWRMILLLGLALAVAEECIIQQTSFAPLIGVPPGEVYGRSLGVNWEYLLWALGFECVWAVVAPIALTHCLFPAERERRWLNRRGITICAVVFLTCSVVAWFTWTQLFLPRFFPDSVYTPPAIAMILAILVITVLIAAAWLLSGSQQRRHTPCPSPRWMIVLSGLAAFAWYSQVLLAFGICRAIPSLAAIVMGVAFGVVLMLVATRWVSSDQWTPQHEWSSILGIVIATACGGAIVLSVSQAGIVDRVGHLLINLLFIGWMARRLATEVRSS